MNVGIVGVNGRVGQLLVKVLKEKKYLVFGSFLVVEEFIKRFDG